VHRAPKRDAIGSHHQADAHPGASSMSDSIGSGQIITSHAVTLQLRFGDRNLERFMDAKLMQVTSRKPHMRFARGSACRIDRAGGDCAIVR